MPLRSGVGLHAVRTSYYVPSSADSSMLALRKWFSEYGGEVPTCTAADAAKEPPLLAKEQVRRRGVGGPRTAASASARSPARR